MRASKVKLAIAKETQVVSTVLLPSCCSHVITGYLTQSLAFMLVVKVVGLLLRQKFLALLPLPAGC